VQQPQGGAPLLIVMPRITWNTSVSFLIDLESVYQQCAP
jgi:hypothetical protein